VDRLKRSNDFSSKDSLVYMSWRFGRWHCIAYIYWRNMEDTKGCKSIDIQIYSFDDYYACNSCLPAPRHRLKRIRRPFVTHNLRFPVVQIHTALFSSLRMLTLESSRQIFSPSQVEPVSLSLSHSSSPPLPLPHSQIPLSILSG
jgi:hypothetical protein